MRLHPHVQELADWISSDPQRSADFHQAIESAASFELLELRQIRTLRAYLEFLSSILTWVPSESVDGTAIFKSFSPVYFVLDQPSAIKYQTRIYPGASSESPSWLSNWIVKFGRTVGQFHDTPASISDSTLATFKACPQYRIDDYIIPDGGYKSFNEFFARKLKPGRRPIASADDENVLVSPADWAYIESFPITMDANITVKTVDWSIRELLSDSKYSELFSGGTAIHGYLNTFDYHRVHAPLGGKVLEANLVSGLHYTQIEAIECAEEPKARSEEDGNYLAAFQQADPSGQLTSNSNNGTVQRTLRKRRVLAPPNEWGYQFNQSRAVVIIETKMGLVAVVPVGMAVVSSVVLSVNEGQVIGKGDELGYFQFGGSDAIVLCQKGVSVDVAIGEHCLMGSRFGRFSST